MILDHATGPEVYSDGDVEEDILSFVTSGRDMDEIVSNDDRWPILYHLDERRRNLLDWFPFDKDDSLLEIGAGCGALTGLFCERLKDVMAVELSPRRAKIIAARYPSAGNLTIMAGRMEDVPLEKEYDYVTLIGVLEYAGRYHRSPNPYLDMLKHAVSMLKPDGTLILAMENKLGLKYWAGAPEDHSGKLFQSLEGYPGEKDIQTFGREELRVLLSLAGLGQQEFYYPYPDYKIPDRIYSDAFQPMIGEIGINTPNYDQPRMSLFDEGLVNDGILANGLYPQMANSFLVLCRR